MSTEAGEVHKSWTGLCRNSKARPRGARLIEGFSPKLGRRLQFFDHTAFAVWIALEATPDVTGVCLSRVARRVF